MIILDTNVLSALMQQQPDPVIVGWLDEGNQPLAKLHAAMTHDRRPASADFRKTLSR